MFPSAKNSGLVLHAFGMFFLISLRVPRRLNGSEIKFAITFALVVSKVDIRLDRAEQSEEFFQGCREQIP